MLIDNLFTSIHSFTITKRCPKKFYLLFWLCMNQTFISLFNLTDLIQSCLLDLHDCETGLGLNIRHQLLRWPHISNLRLSLLEDGDGSLSLLNHSRDAVEHLEACRNVIAWYYFCVSRRNSPLLYFSTHPLGLQHSHGYQSHLQPREDSQEPWRGWVGVWTVEAISWSWSWCRRSLPG